MSTTPLALNITLKLWPIEKLFTLDQHTDLAHTIEKTANLKHFLHLVHSAKIKENRPFVLLSN